ncbi:hypothetical protein HaLaN_25985, partial [Haematococcus lacustris]
MGGAWRAACSPPGCCLPSSTYATLSSSTLQCRQAGAFSFGIEAKALPEADMQPFPAGLNQQVSRRWTGRMCSAAAAWGAGIAGHTIAAVLSTTTTATTDNWCKHD